MSPSPSRSALVNPPADTDYSGWEVLRDQAQLGLFSVAGTEVGGACLSEMAHVKTQVAPFDVLFGPEAADGLAHLHDHWQDNVKVVGIIVRGITPENQELGHPTSSGETSPGLHVPTTL